MSVLCYFLHSTRETMQSANQILTQERVGKKLNKKHQTTLVTQPNIFNVNWQC